MTAASGRRRECDDVKREVSTNEVQGEPASADWRREGDGVVLRGEAEQRIPRRNYNIMGKLIVLEGIDGCGKSTQIDLLCGRLADEGLGFRRLSFPRYSEPSSALIKMYLNGEFGNDPDSVNAYAASSFFAVDRYASFVQDWREYYESGGTVLTDRYTTSNAIHQGAKLPQEQREKFFKWLYDYEFNLMRLPAPDLVIYLDMDAAHSARRLAARQSETGTTGDIHETKVDYLKKCAESGNQAAEFFGWKKVKCMAENRERTISEICEEIYSLFG